MLKPASTLTFLLAIVIGQGCDSTKPKHTPDTSTEVTKESPSAVKQVADTTKPVGTKVQAAPPREFGTWSIEYSGSENGQMEGKIGMMLTVGFNTMVKGTATAETGGSIDLTIITVGDKRQARMNFSLPNGTECKADPARGAESKVTVQKPGPKPYLADLSGHVLCGKDESKVLVRATLRND